jgi:hypothetical protein
MVDRDKEKEYLSRMQRFLLERWKSRGVGGDVRRHELEAIADEVGLGRQRSWDLFRASEGVVWQGQYMPESHSEERGYTALRLWRVHP